MPLLRAAERSRALLEQVCRAAGLEPVQDVPDWRRIRYSGCGDLALEWVQLPALRRRIGPYSGGSAPSDDNLASSAFCLLVSLAQTKSYDCEIIRLTSLLGTSSSRVTLIQ